MAKYKPGDKVGLFKIIKISPKTDTYKHTYYETKCLFCGRIDTHREDMVDFSKRYPTKNKPCFHTSYTKNGGFNDIPNFKKQSKENEKIYKLWNDILRRTSPEFWKEYPTYEGTQIDPNWKILSKFVEEIKQVEGYEKWLNGKPKEYILDKDLKSPTRPAIYSKDTCCFITWKESYDEIENRKHDFLRGSKQGYSTTRKKYGQRIKMINLETGEEKFFLSMPGASLFLGWNESNVEQTLRLGRTNIKDNWKFFKITNEEYEEALKNKKYTKNNFPDKETATFKHIHKRGPYKNKSKK